MFEQLLLIQLICVLITDVAGAPEDMLEPLVKKLTGSKVGKLADRPWKCSLCQTFWTGLIYLLVTGNFTLVNFTLVLLVACLTPVTVMMWFFANDFLKKMINVIYDYFNL